MPSIDLREIGPDVRPSVLASVARAALASKDGLAMRHYFGSLSAGGRDDAAAVLDNILANPSLREELRLALHHIGGRIVGDRYVAADPQADALEAMSAARLRRPTGLPGGQVRWREDVLSHVRMLVAVGEARAGRSGFGHDFVPLVFEHSGASLPQRVYEPAYSPTAEPGRPVWRAHPAVGVHHPDTPPLFLTLDAAMEEATQRIEALDWPRIRPRYKGDVDDPDLRARSGRAPFMLSHQHDEDAGAQLVMLHAAPRPKDNAYFETFFAGYQAARICDGTTMDVTRLPGALPSQDAARHVAEARHRTARTSMAVRPPHGAEPRSMSKAVARPPIEAARPSRMQVDPSARAARSQASQVGGSAAPRPMEGNASTTAGVYRLPAVRHEPSEFDEDVLDDDGPATLTP